jgi:hypothetical protein
MSTVNSIARRFRQSLIIPSRSRKPSQSRCQRETTSRRRIGITHHITVTGNKSARASDNSVERLKTPYAVVFQFKLNHSPRWDTGYRIIRSDVEHHFAGHRGFESGMHSKYIYILFYLAELFSQKMAEHRALREEERRLEEAQRRSSPRLI